MDIRQTLGPALNGVVRVAWVLALYTGPANANQSLDLRFGLGATSVDNFYFSDQQQTAGLGGLAKSRLDYKRPTANSLFQALASAEYASFDTSSRDTYFDADVSLDYATVFARNRFKFGSAFVRGHDPFGRVRTEGTQAALAELDIWNQYAATVGWEYGSRTTTKTLIEVDAAHRDRQYQTNQDGTSVLDRSMTRVSLALGYRPSVKTSIFLNPFVESIDFDEEIEGTAIRSGDNEGLLVGMRWSATSRTRGDIRIGEARRSLDGSGSEFQTRFWNASVEWRPSQSDVLDVLTERRFRPSYIAGAEFIDDRRVAFSWVRQSRSNLTYNLNLGADRRLFVGLDQEDRNFYSSIGVSLRLGKSLVSNGSISYTERQSDRANVEFDQLRINLGFDLLVGE